MTFGQKRLIGVGMCVCALSLALCGCNKKQDAAPAESDAKSVAEQTATDANKAEESKQDAKDEATKADEQGETQSGIADAGNKIDDKTLDTWSNKARSFLTIYPANYVHAGGENDEPMEMSLEDWASNCLSYVDPNSSLGQSLANNPDVVATPLGFHDAATVVESCEVTGANVGGVNVTVTMKTTQNTWRETDTHTRSYLVQFNNDNMITNVVDTH